LVSATGPLVLTGWLLLLARKSLMCGKGIKVLSATLKAGGVSVLEINDDDCPVIPLGKAIDGME
jgi:hypothetical protein